MSEDLPFGSRGGTAVRHYFPADGEYIVRLQFQGSSRTPEPVEVSVDGLRVAELRSGGRNQEDAKDKGAVDTRVSVKAGSRVLGVSFVKPILPVETRYPSTTRGATARCSRPTRGGWIFERGASRHHTAVQRRRLATHRPGASFFNAGRRMPGRKIRARRKSWARSRGGRSAGRHGNDVQPLVAFYKNARTGATSKGAIQLALERLLVDPDFPSGSSGTRPPVPPARRIGSAISGSPRDSFFLWSSIPDGADHLAERGRLKDPATLEARSGAMRRDSRFTMLVDNFAAQWLYRGTSSWRNRIRFSSLTGTIISRAALVEETERFREPAPATIALERAADCELHLPQ
jgi:hypothetical protein